jgi:hypothetical protein
MKKEIDKLLISGAVRIAEQEELEQNPGVVSRMFPVLKKDGRPRPVINLRTINPYVPPVHFKMEGLKTVRQLLQQGDWMVKIDLEDAFHHVPIAPHSQKYFRFRWGSNTYQWQCMPFGYRDAPRTFTRLMRVIAKEARSRGIRMVVYMDDILLMSRSQQESIEDRDNLLQLLADFGLTISQKKCVLTPSQQMEFLGVVVDSITMTLSLSTEKLTKLAARARKMRLRASEGKRTAVRPLQKLVGHLQSVSDCVLPTRLHSNSLREALRCAESDLRYTVLLSQQAIEDLMWWEEQLPAWNGKKLNEAPPEFQFDTDASEKGWGAVYYPPAPLTRLECQGFFTEELTSNTRELTAVLNGMTSICRSTNWSNCSVRVRTDNQVTMSYINRMGGREPHLARIAESIHNFCLERKILLIAEYLPGILNSAADSLSRVECDHSESKLHHSLFQLIDSRWGPHTLDGLASETNSQLHRHISYRQNPTCLYTDLFSRPLDEKENCWLFPPAAGPLIPRCLNKIRREQLSATMIIPVWPSQPWWPLVWPLCQDWPLILPRHPTTLTNWVEGKEKGSLPFWPLVAVRLSGDTSKCRAWHRALSTYGSIRTKAEQMVTLTKDMIASGLNTKVGSTIEAAAHTISMSLTSQITSRR